jgi:cysteine synthase
MRAAVTQLQHAQPRVAALAHRRCTPSLSRRAARTKTVMASSTYPTVEDTVGNTPLVRLQRLQGRGCSNTILLKLEGNNPAGSVKDRPALCMIQEAEKAGRIKPGDTLIEATSGNTGIALAMAASIKGYKMKLIMPANMSEERRLAMSAYGASAQYGSARACCTRLAPNTLPLRVTTQRRTLA